MKESNLSDIESHKRIIDDYYSWFEGELKKYGPETKLKRPSFYVVKNNKDVNNAMNDITKKYPSLKPWEINRIKEEINSVVASENLYGMHAQPVSSFFVKELGDDIIGEETAHNIYDQICPDEKGSVAEFIGYVGRSIYRSYKEERKLPYIEAVKTSNILKNDFDELSRLSLIAEDLNKIPVWFAVEISDVAKSQKKYRRADFIKEIGEKKRILNQHLGLYESIKHENKLEIYKAFLNEIETAAKKGRRSVINCLKKYAKATLSELEKADENKLKNFHEKNYKFNLYGVCDGFGFDLHPIGYMAATVNGNCTPEIFLMNPKQIRKKYFSEIDLKMNKLTEADKYLLYYFEREKLKKIAEPNPLKRLCNRISNYFSSLPNENTQFSLAENKKLKKSQE